jgi:hypothetical protein
VSFPINVATYRELAEDWRGEVVICDIDRTYLATEFSSWGKLLRIPFELAIEKQDLPGMAALLREIRRGPRRESRHTPLYFVSASPPQLRSVIERKMLLDDLEFDGTVFKDWLGVVRSGRFQRFREQLGFKLTALLKLQRELPLGATDVLLGDDLESDSLAFSIYADLLAQRLVAADLPRILSRQGVSDEDAAAILAMVQRIEPGPQVKRICIRLERHDAAHFVEYAPHLVAAQGALQIALCLHADRCLSLEGVVRVARSLVGRGITRDELHDRLSDAARRAIVSLDAAQEVYAALAERGLAASRALPLEVDPLWRDVVERDAGEPWTPLRLLS